MEDKKCKVQKVQISAEELKKMGPQEVVMSNAKTLVSADLETAKEFIELSTKAIVDLTSNTDDFTKDAASLINMQVQLASLSLAVEYWMAKLREGRIKIYNNADMPKA